MMGFCRPNALLHYCGMQNIFINSCNWFCALDVVHKFVRDGYYKRFPELESLVHLPLEYVKTVKVRSPFSVIVIFRIWQYSTVFENKFTL